LVEPDTPYGVGPVRSLLSAVRGAVDLLPHKWQLRTRRLRAEIDDADGRLAQIEKMVELYLPVMNEGFHVVECRALDRLLVVEEEWRFEPERIDWRTYWLDVHVPGLRRWAFPLIEGKRPERYRPLHAVRLVAPEAPAEQGYAAE